MGVLENRSTFSDKILVGLDFESEIILATYPEFGHFCPTKKLVHS